LGVVISVSRVWEIYVVPARRRPSLGLASR
jgi:hypothetical protein